MSGDTPFEGVPEATENPRIMPNLIDPTTITHVWYHANCADGYAAATAAWRVLRDRAEYAPVRHGDPHPEIPSTARLAIVDFAYPRDQLLEIQQAVSELVVLDHHRSAAKDLEGLEFARFDMDKSGARMAWEYWHPGKPLPELFAYVEDRDLWRWQLPESREVALALTQVPVEFETWGDSSVEELKIMGRGLLGYQNSLIARAVSKAHWVDLAGYNIPVANSCLFQSEIGDELCLKFPEAPFAGVFYDKGEYLAWSLRSVGQFDVSEVASKFGGGGHRNASGFAMARSEWTP